MKPIYYNIFSLRAIGLNKNSAKATKSLDLARRHCSNFAANNFTAIDWRFFGDHGNFIWIKMMKKREKLFTITSTHHIRKSLDTKMHSRWITFTRPSFQSSSLWREREPGLAFGLGTGSTGVISGSGWGWEAGISVDILKQSLCFLGQKCYWKKLHHRNDIIKRIISKFFNLQCFNVAVVKSNMRKLEKILGFLGKMISFPFLKLWMSHQLLLFEISANCFWGPYAFTNVSGKLLQCLPGTWQSKSISSTDR